MARHGSWAQEQGGGPVDYRQIRDILRSSRQANVSDAYNTPPPPVRGPSTFAPPPPTKSPSHPDVWGSKDHPYHAAPQGMAQLLTTGGSPLKEESEESEQPPEPPVVMRRTRFFASIRTSVNELRNTVVGKMEAYCLPEDDDEDNALLSGGGALFSEEREEMRKAQEAKTEKLMEDVNRAFQEAAESLGQSVYGAFQYAGSKHIQLERIREMARQRDEDLGMQMEQVREQAEEKLEAEAEKLDEAEDRMVEMRNEWRKMLLMAHARSSTERDLQHEVAHLKRGMKQLLGDVDSTTARHRMAMMAEKSHRREEVAALQQKVHEAQNDAERMRESLQTKRYELDDANNKLSDLRSLVTGQEKHLEKQNQSLDELRKLEIQLRDFMQKQGERSLEDWHTNLRGLAGPTLHDKELTYGSHGFAKGTLELMSQQKLLTAQRWLRGLFPGGFPLYTSLRKANSTDDPAPPTPTKPDPLQPEEAKAAEQPAPEEPKTPKGGACLPLHLRRVLANAAEASRVAKATPPLALRATHEAIGEIYHAYLTASPPERSQGLPIIGYSWFLSREGSPPPAEVQAEALLVSALLYSAKGSGSPRCRLFCRLMGATEFSLAPPAAAEACLQSWGCMVRPEGGSSTVETESGLIFINQDRVKTAVETAGGSVELQRNTMGKIRIKVRPEHNKKSRTNGMLSADEIAAVVLDEWGNAFLSSVESKLRTLYVQHDCRADGTLELKDFAAMVDAACGAEQFNKLEVVDMYLEARRIAEAHGSEPGRMSQESVSEVARFWGWSLAEAAEAEPAAAQATISKASCAAIWGLLEPLVRSHLSALGSSGIDTQPAEVLVQRLCAAFGAEEGSGSSAQAAWEAMKTLLAVHSDVVLRGLQLPRAELTQAGKASKFKSGKRGSNKGEATPALEAESSATSAGSGAPLAAVSQLGDAAEGDPELQHKLQMLQESVEQQLSMASENARELEARLKTAEARADAAEATFRIKSRPQSQAGASKATDSATMGALEAQLAEKTRQARDAEKKLTNIQGKLLAMGRVAQGMKFQHKALKAEAQHQRSALQVVVQEGVEKVVDSVRAAGWGTALAASALASARSSSTSKSTAHDPSQTPGPGPLASGPSASELSPEPSGYLASPRVAQPAKEGVPKLPMMAPRASGEGLESPLEAVGSEASFARRVDEDFRAYELEVRNMRFDARLDDLEQLVTETATARDRPAAFSAAGLEVGNDEAEDELLEETSQRSLVCLRTPQVPGGPVVNAGELQSVAEILHELSASSLRTGSSTDRAGKLLKELSSDSFLRDGPQIPGVEHLVWEGMGGAGSGLAPPRPIGGRGGRGAYATDPRPSDTGSTASDWDREYDPMAAPRGPYRPGRGGPSLSSNADELLAEGTALLQSRAMGGSPEVGEELFFRMGQVREAAKVVDSEAVQLEQKVEKVRAANQALTSRSSELDVRAERLRVAGNMLERQAHNLEAKASLVQRERAALQAEHLHLKSGRDRLASVAVKLKTRKLNLRAAEAIYVHKWQRLEAMAWGLGGMEASLGVVASDLRQVGATLVQRAAGLGMELSPMALPPPHAVESAFTFGPVPSSQQRKGRPTSAGGRRASQSHLSPPSSRGRARPASAHPPSPSRYLASHLPEGHPEASAVEGIGGGVVGRPLSAERSRRGDSAPGAARTPSPIATFASSSPMWLREGGEVQDAPRELHAPLRQLHALAIRLEQTSERLSAFGEDVLGSAAPAPPAEGGSPRDFLNILANPGQAAQEDPAAMAALVAEVIQARIDRAAIATHLRQADHQMALQSAQMAPAEAHHIPTYLPRSPVGSRHSPGGAAGRDWPYAPGPTPRVGFREVPHATGSDVVDLARRLMGQDQARQQQQQRGRLNYRPSSSVSTPGGLAVPAGPVLGGSQVPRDRRAQSAHPSRRSAPQAGAQPTDMLAAVAKGIEQQQQRMVPGGEAGHRGASKNRVLSNHMSGPNPAARRSPEGQRAAAAGPSAARQRPHHGAAEPAGSPMQVRRMAGGQRQQQRGSSTPQK